MTQQESHQRPVIARGRTIAPQAAVDGSDGGRIQAVIPLGRRPAWRVLLAAAVSSPVASSALKIALVVGTLLNLINQGDALLDGSAISLPRLLLNYGVPYLVATYSAAWQALRNCEL